MGIRYNEKGKYFTDLVSKETVAVVIQTPTHLLHGQVHVRKEDRLSDELNRSEQFMPVTDVAVYDLAGQLVRTCDFLAVSRDFIVWITPEHDELPSDIPGGRE